MLIVCIFYKPKTYKNAQIPWKQVAVLIPVFGDPDHLPETVQSVLRASQPGITICVIDNGPTHINSSILRNYYVFRQIKIHNVLDLEHVYYHQIPSGGSIVILEKSQPGKGLALNIGIRLISSQFIICLDADTIVAKDAIRNILAPLLSKDNPALAAGGAIIPIRGENILCNLQESEYLKAFLFNRIFFSAINENMLISGAFGAFRRDVLISHDIQGYDIKCIGEDLELSVKIQAHASQFNTKHAIQYVSDACCYTHVPNNTKAFSRQRERWQRGLIQVFRKHPPDDDPISNFSWWYFFIFEKLSPVIESLGFILTLINATLGKLKPSHLMVMLVIPTMLNFIIYLYASNKTNQSPNIFRIIITVMAETIFLHPILICSRLRAHIKNMLDEETTWK